MRVILRLCFRTGYVLLQVAVLVYYVSIVAVDLRPDAGLGSLVRAAAIWSVVSVVGGPVAGLLGWAGHRGPTRLRALAWGAGGGLLASQGIFEAARYPSLVFSTPPRSLALVVWPLLIGPVAAVILATRHRGLGTALAVMLPVGLAGAAVWAVVVGRTVSPS